MSSIRWPGLIMLWATISAAGQQLQLSPVEVAHALVVTGELQEITASLTNPGAVTIEDVLVDLSVPPGWQADPVRIEIPALAPYATHPIRFRLLAETDSNGDGRVIVAGGGREVEAAFHLSSCQPLATSMVLWQTTEPAVGHTEEDDCVYVATGSYIVFLPRCGTGRGSGLVYLRRGREWTRIATLPALGHVLYADGDHTGERWICPQSSWIPPRSRDGDYLLTLRDQWTDDSGRDWTAKVFFAPTADPRIIKCTHAVWCNQAAMLYRFEGPMTCAGDGTFGASRTGYVLPALEPEPRGDGALLARGDASAPGRLAVAAPAGGVVGLLYDPNQRWSSDRRGAHGLFASPNRLYHQQNSYLALMAPLFDPGQPSWARKAARPHAMAPGAPVYLRSELFVSPGGTIDEVAQAWQERFGSPDGPGHRGNPLD